MRCTTIYMSERMSEHASDLETHGVISHTIHRHKRNHSHTMQVSNAL